jgi:hypothetical protein
LSVATEPATGLTSQNRKDLGNGDKGGFAPPLSVQARTRRQTPALQETRRPRHPATDEPFIAPEAVERYVTQEIAHETDVQRRLRAETAGMPHGGMQIGADQGAARVAGETRRCAPGDRDRHLHRLQRAGRRICAPVDGKLICCDVSEEWTSVARRYWQEAGVAGRIELASRPRPTRSRRC